MSKDAIMPLQSDGNPNIWGGSTEIDSRGEAPEKTGLGGKAPEIHHPNLPGYTLLREIGSGSQADVFLARQETSGKLVAVKRLHIDSVRSWKQYELFSREAAVLKSLHVHGTAQYYDFFEDLEGAQPSAYIVQEYLEGKTLQKLLDDGHRFTQDEIYGFAIQVLHILTELHRHDPPVIHRDIKPSNIIINDRKEVFLIDFGAVSNPRVQSGGSTVAGTYGYMPPEQLMGHAEAASDIYALAAVLLFLFTGVSPVDMPVEQLEIQFEPLMEDAPESLILLLKCMLSKNPQHRFCDTEKLAEVFDDFRRGHFHIHVDTILYRTEDAGELQIRRISRKKQIEAYRDRLRDVKYIGQPGNIELWQLLNPSNAPTTYRESVGKYSSILLIAVSIVVLVACVYVYVGHFSLLMTLLQLGSLALVVRVVFENNEMDCLKKIPSLLRNGRKGLATITDIQYVPSKNRRMIVPMFQITYSFYIEAVQKTAIHTFPSHVSPEKRYRIGEQIPIVYALRDHNREVSSIPFPFSISNAVNHDALICTSGAEKWT